MDTKKTTNKFSARFASGRFEWCGLTKATTPRNGRRLRRSPRRLAARPRACGVGCGRLSAMRGCAPVRRRMNGNGSKRWSEKTASFVRRRTPRKASADFRPGGARPPVQAMIAFIDDHREAHGVEPICEVLPIAPSTYRAHAGDAPRSREGLGEGAARCGFARENPARLRRQFPGLWRAQGLAAVAAGGRKRGALHGRAADAGHGFARRRARQAGLERR